MNIKEIFNNISNILSIIFGIILFICFIFSIISVVAYKKRNGNYPIGQGYGKK